MYAFAMHGGTCFSAKYKSVMEIYRAWKNTSKGQKIWKKFQGKRAASTASGPEPEAQTAGACLSLRRGILRSPSPAGLHEGVGRSLPALRSRESVIYSYERKGVRELQPKIHMEVKV